jgi:dipeptidyl aminopeptidase/acylaminoacyl peptidase
MKAFLGSIWVLFLVGMVNIRLVSCDSDDIPENTNEIDFEGVIAFISGRDGNNEIYLMNTDGSNRIQITDNDVPDVLPKWSPDGNTIVFSSSDSQGTEGIFLIDADGTNRRVLVQTTYGDNDDEVSIVHVSSGNITRLTTSAGWDSTPAWK